MQSTVPNVDAGRESPACLRQVAAALAANDAERAWAAIDQSGAGAPLLVARALAARDRMSFLRRLLKRLPLPQRAALHHVIAAILNARPLSLTPASSVPDAALDAWRSEDEQAFLASAAAVRDSLASVVLAAADVVAGQLYPVLVQRPVSLVSLEFDHSATASATSALHLRRDGQSTVSRPEWVPGMLDAAACPVLYAAEVHSATTVTIKARFSISHALPSGAVEVRAVEGGMLGAIDAFVVVPRPRGMVSIDVPLSHLGLYGSTQSDVSWRWEYRLSGGAWQFLARTQHRVYCTPRQPNEPWNVAQRDVVANPWTAALDIACQAANLAGLDDEMDGLAAGLCELLNPGGLAPNPFRLAYTVDDAGEAHYNGPNGTLDLSALLDRAAGGDGNGELVNCDDCAGPGGGAGEPARLRPVRANHPDQCDASGYSARRRPVVGKRPGRAAGFRPGGRRCADLSPGRLARKQ